KIYAFLAKELKKDSKTCLITESQAWAKRIEQNFPVYFLNDAAYLNDVVVQGEAPDDTFRPNQIYVLSLPFSLLKKKEEKQIFEAIQQHLFTPYGLRTLKEDHEAFKPIYQGDQWNRDTAYHQGTIWPFLLGAYYTAQLKLYRNTKKLRAEILENIQVLENHFYNSDGIHCISEIFDGSDPSDGRGTIQQAWSISALLQVFYNHDLLR
ncbi:MAG: amylo-alpha-1,6-glucosidase, partial [Bacteroidota bacterium]